MKRQGLVGRMPGGAGRSRPPLRPPAVAAAAADRSLLALPLLLLLLATVAAPPSVHAEDPPLPTFTQEPESAIVAHHQSVTLRCRAEPPTARTGWLFNGEPLDPDSHRGLQTQGSDLYFPRFSHGAEDSGNDGEYRCTATTAAGTVVSRPAVLSKPVLRSFPTSDDIVITAYEGGFATIPCTAPYSHPPATIQVQTSTGRLLNEAQAGKVHLLPSGSVVLTDLDPSDTGNYTCVAVNPVSGHNRSATYVINLTVTPKSQGVGVQTPEIVDQSTATLEVTSGDSVLLECPVAGLGARSIFWSRGYGSLPQGHTISQFGNLHISSVDLRDGGTYICETPSGQKRQVRLEVQMPPAVSSDPADGVVTAEAGDTVRLTCKGGAFPAPSMTWFHNGRRHGRPSMNSAGEVHSIVLQQVRFADEGLYVCELSNRLGQARAVLQLIVQPSDGDVDTNTDIPVDGSVVNAAPGEVLPIDDDDDDVNNNRNFHLKTQNNNKNRNGRKRKKNGKKNKKKHRRRKKGNKGGKKKVKLVPPSAPSVSRVSDTAVMVHWSVPENDGLPISLFRIQYKEVEPNNGQWQTVDDDISAKSRRYKVSRLKSGGTYKFRMAAVYSNNDNRNSPNSRRFHLKVNPYPEPHPPKVTPKIVEAKSMIYQSIHAIGIKWQYFPVDSTSIDGFYIYHKPYGLNEEFEMQMLEGPGIRHHLLTDLKPDTEYSIRMKCFNAAGASDYSNMVVKRTLPGEGQTPADLPTIVLPPGEKETEAPPTSRREAGGLDQPVILGIVLGIMLLLLVVFIAMCWWKQRQQKRRNQSSESCAKFKDQAHRIYTDSLHKKHPNGGPYPLSGMNGLALANGHGPPHGQPRLTVDANPLSDMDHMHHRSHSPPNHRDLYSGKPYPHGNGMIPNGTLPGYGHGHNSDNNFNNIRQTVSSDNVLSMGMVPNGINSMGSLQRGGNGVGYVSRPYSPPAHSKTSLSSFSPGSHLQHHRGESLSHSDDADSPDEAEPLARENPRYARDVPPAYRSLQAKGHMRNSRDNVNGPYDRRPCYGYDGAYDSVSGSAGFREEGPGFHHWSAGPAPSPSSSSHTGKHKRRRKRPHSEREHTMKDQATNTDLSSNEGTIEFGMLNKSPSSSVSNGSDNSMTSQSAEAKTVTANGSQSVGMLTTPMTVVPVGPL